MTRAWAALAAAALAGCSPAPPSVSGVVTAGGSPVAGAVVRFHPAGRAGAPPYFTVTRADGTFAVPPADAGRAGLPPGKYKVTVAKFKTSPVSAASPAEFAPAASALPPRYADPATTPLAATLRPGANRLDLKLDAR